MQRGAGTEGTARGATEEGDDATAQGPKNGQLELAAHNADPEGAQTGNPEGAHASHPGGQSACGDCRNRCGDCGNHPRAGNTLYVAISLGIYALAPYTLAFLLHELSITANKFINEEMSLDDVWTRVLAGFIRVSPLVLYKGSATLYCMVFEQIVGQTFVNPVNSLILAFGLRLTFRTFAKLFYLDLVPFGWTWWLAVVFDLVRRVRV